MMVHAQDAAMEKVLDPTDRVLSIVLKGILTLSKMTAHPHANLVQYCHALFARLQFAVNVYQAHIYILAFARLVFRTAELVHHN